VSKLQDIEYSSLGLCYGLMIIPLAIILWLQLPLLKATVVAVIRMTVQLLLVGFYLKFIFKLDSVWINGGWLLVMVLVADASIIRRAGLRMRFFILPVAIGLGLGTIIPLLVFLHVVLNATGLLQAQYAIPIGGMIMGNCLRANIIGIKEFYFSIRSSEKVYLSRLAMGASLKEAIRPNFRKACESALSPTVATMGTIGLVSLPGMMTGVIMGGHDPAQAIKYQIAIMLAIFSGTAITVYSVLWLTVKFCFDEYGLLNKRVFPDGK
jgi:putative ABC transport system permease protein